MFENLIRKYIQTKRVNSGNVMCEKHVCHLMILIIEYTKMSKTCISERENYHNFLFQMFRKFSAHTEIETTLNSNYLKQSFFIVFKYRCK